MTEANDMLLTWLNIRFESKNIIVERYARQ